MQNREFKENTRGRIWKQFSWILALASVCVTLQAQTPPTTTVSDTVFRADGSPAAGTLLISWPAFTTAAGAAIAGGTKSVTLGSGGALSVALVPNAGATPATTVYTVVYQLTDGTVKTEYWVVPASSPTNVATIRTTLGSGGAATSLASKQYVDTSVAGKASDAAVVHKTGSETITGVKQFSTAPSVPVPVGANDAVNKAYVDTALAGVGSGAFVTKSGDAMSGPLQLSADPTAANQAANRHYVDTGLAGKADLTSGVVPPAELGSGTSSGSTCLKGNSTWGACGTSSDAISIQTVPVDTVAPSDNQVITYDATSGKYKPKAGGGVTAGMQAVKYAVDFSWSQSPAADLSAPGAKTVTLSACPSGVKASEPQYYVYISGTGTFEAVQVTGGTCNGNGSSGTLQFTTLNAHPSGYTVSTASGGLQEALIAARYVPTNPTGTSQAGVMIVPPGEFKVFGRVSIRSSNITVDFSGSIVECQLNDTCIFVGDGITLRFYLSQSPFTRTGRTIVDEEYKGTTLDPTRWTLTDPGSVISVNGGKLQVAGGNGVDGHTLVQFVEQVELGGAFTLQHGDFIFTGASDGVLGGLYVTSVSTANCIAGFRISPSGSASTIQALVNGGVSGPVITTSPTHRYVLTSRFYALEIYRKQQVFHSSARPAGNPRGGAGISANVRVVLEVHDIDSLDPLSSAQPSTVLFDGVLTAAPGYCLYALVNASNVHCSIAFTRILQAVDTEVRSALPGSIYRTRLVGSLSEGAECQISSSGPSLQFYTSNIPAPNELIEVHYRGHGTALTRVTNPASIAALANGNDDGIRAAVRDIKSPTPRTAADCENAALAIYDDAGSAWAGVYQTWSDFLPQNAEDIFPGDALAVSAPTRAASFTGIVREADIQVKDLDQDHSIYKLNFANESSQPLGFEFQSSRIQNLSNIAAIPIDQVGTNYIADLTLAAITDQSSTTVTVDAGAIPPPGGGIEIRRSDSGWGQDNDRNLIGRYATQTAVLPRLSRVQDYYLRQYDASTPPRYSRYTAALHLDYPL